MNFKNKLYKLSIVTFVLAFLSLAAFVYFKSSAYINADDSAELVLARLLASNNQLWSTDWYYSTELRIFSPQFIYMPVFKIFGTFFRTRVISTILLFGLLVASYYYFLKQFALEKYFFIGATILLLPFSNQYFEYVYKGLHYIFYIAIIFYTLGAIEKYLHTKKWQVLILPMLIAFGSSCNSIRQIYHLYLPIFLVSILFILCRRGDENNKSFFLVTFLLLVFAGLGYVFEVNYLSKIFISEANNSISFTLRFDQFFKIISGFFTSLGDDRFIYFKLAAIVITIVFFVVCVLLLEVEDEGAWRLSLYTILCILMFIGTYLFTDMQFFARYNLPIVVMILPLVSIFVEKYEYSDKVKRNSMILFSLVMLSFGIYRYVDRFMHDDNTELRKIAYALTEAGYKEGLAGFWDGNVLDELSGGELEIFVYKIDPEEFCVLTDVFDRNTWLDEKRHSLEDPEGKTFVIFRKDCLRDGDLKNFNYQRIIYDTEKYVIYGYESYDALVKEVK